MMDNKQLYDLAKGEERAYKSRWRAANRDRIKQYNAKYWAKRALRRLQEVNGDAAHEDDQTGNGTHQGN